MAKKYRRTHRLSRLRNLSMHWYGFIFFIAVAIFLIAFDQIRPEQTAKIKSQMISYSVPVFEVLSKPVQTFGNFITTAKNFIETKYQNDEMRKEIAQLRANDADLARLKSENRALRQLLNLQEETTDEYVTARIIADNSWQFYRTVLLNAGTKDGIRKDMYAMADNGLVGRIIEVGTNHSRVLLLQDWASRIPVTIADTDVRAVIAGRNTATGQLIHLTGGNLTDLKRNMTVMTSGRGGVFPPGLPIGKLQIAEANSTDSEAISKYSVIPYSNAEDVTFLKIYTNPKPIQVITNADQQP